MKQKYVLLKNIDKNELTIQEFAELDKAMFSLLCEETYPLESVQSAAAQSKKTLIAILRTPNLYPIGHHAELIADAAIRISNGADNDSTEIVFNDLDLIAQNLKEAEAAEDIEPEADEVDNLLDEDVDDTYQDAIAINKIKSVIKVVDDDSGDGDDAV